MPEQTFFTITLTAKKTIATDVMEFRFDRPTGFTFLPGQFVQFRVANGTGFVLRSYSISSAPQDPYLEFCVKILPDGVASQFFAGLQIGETAQISIARGQFVLPKDSSNNIFIATGTGLAPVISMIGSLVSSPVLVGTSTTGSLLPVSQKHEVLFGVRTQADMFWQERLQTLATQVPGLTLRLTLSQPDSAWTGLSGRVTEHVTIDLDAHYYICGNLPMVKDVRAKLTAANVPAKNIHLEIF